MVKPYKEIKTKVSEIRAELENFNRDYDTLVNLGKLQPDKEKMRQIYHQISLIENIMGIGPEFMKEKRKIDVIKYSLGNIGRAISVIGHNIEVLDLNMRFFKDTANRAIASEKNIRAKIGQALDKLPSKKVEKSIFDLRQLEEVDEDVKNLVIYLLRFKLNNLIEYPGEIEKIVNNEYADLKQKIKSKDEKEIAKSYETFSRTLKDLRKIFKEKMDDLLREGKTLKDVDVFQLNQARQYCDKIILRTRDILGFRLENTIEQDSEKKKGWQIWK